MPGDVVRLYVFATNLESGAPFTDAERRRAERLAQHDRERSKERA